MPFTHPDQLVGGHSMAAFLDMLEFSEGTTTVASSDDGYNVNVGGELFTGYDRHPRIVMLTRRGLSDEGWPLPDHGRRAGKDQDRHVGLGEPRLRRDGLQPPIA